MMPLRRTVAAWLPGVLAAACWPLPTAAVAAQDPGAPPPSRTVCGDYEAIATGSVGTRPTRLLLQRKGRVLTTVTDWAITGVTCADLTGDRQPELLAETFNGGAHCCGRVRVWSLAARPRLLLDYAAGNAPGATLRDLDGDGRQELLLGDDGLAYFDDLDYASSPSGVPLVVCFNEGAFRDCSAEHPEVLREAGMRFRDRLDRRATPETAPRVRGGALGLLAVSMILGEEASALAVVREATQDEELLAWLARVRPKLLVWAEARGRKLKRPGS